MRTRTRRKGGKPPEKTLEQQVEAFETMRVAVVADTHSKPHAQGVSHLQALRPDLILHAGDIGDDAVIHTLAQIAPTLVVRGNIDPRDRADHLRIRLHRGETTWLVIYLTHIAVRGPRLMPSVAEVAKRRGAGLVICGHSHVPLIASDRGLSVFNPGSIGPRRFALPITFGMIELKGPGRIGAHHIDCETGERWTPPQEP